jgi:hypothetical protein
MTLRRTVLSWALAGVLGAVGMHLEPQFASAPWKILGATLLTAILGAPAFLPLGFWLARFVAEREPSTDPGRLRLVAMIRGIATGAGGFSLLSIFYGLLSQESWLFRGLPLLYPIAAVASGIGLGLGSLIGIGRKGA